MMDRYDTDDADANADTDAGTHAAGTWNRRCRGCCSSTSSSRRRRLDQQSQQQNRWRKASWCLVILSCLNALRVHLLRPWWRHHHQQQTQQHQQQPQLRPLSSSSDKNNNFNNIKLNRPGPPPPRRLLYIVTSLTEYDTGKRQTTKGNDRFSHTLVPVVQESVGTMLQTGLFEQVDVQLIAHYEVSQERRQELYDALLLVSSSSSQEQQQDDYIAASVSVGLQVWDDATPLGYDADDRVSRKKHILVPVLRSLARQHRYVIKDQFFRYDVFCAFEDDMVVTGNHVRHFLDLTQQLYELRLEAPESLPVAEVPTPAVAMERYHGAMTQLQLERCLPGFIRVEAVLPGFRPHSRNLVDIPIDYQWNTTSNSNNGTAAAAVSATRHINASVCCHLNDSYAWLPHQTPTRPLPSELYYWETSIEALSIRQLPRSISGGNKNKNNNVKDDGQWVLLQGGNIDLLSLDPSYVLGGYWVGRAHARDTTIPYLADNLTTTSSIHAAGAGAVDPGTGRLYFENNPTRPDPTKGRYLNNQGGWMGTRRQIRDWHFRHCRGGFLPPYDDPFFEQDGLKFKTVEFWSGGIAIAGVMSCNLQRVVALDPDLFSHHLLYHVSNNKQKESNVRYRFSSHTIDEFWGQLNAVRKSAERDKEKTTMPMTEEARRRDEQERRQQAERNKKDGFLFS